MICPADWLAGCLSSNFHFSLLSIYTTTNFLLVSSLRLTTQRANYHEVACILSSLENLSFPHYFATLEFGKASKEWMMSDEFLLSASLA